MISLVLFCIFFDEYLGKLTYAGIAAILGMFLLVLLQILLLAPTASAMRLVLGICDHYALEYLILFNAKKSKCIYNYH